MTSNLFIKQAWPLLPHSLIESYALYYFPGKKNTMFGVVQFFFKLYFPAGTNPVNIHLVLHFAPYIRQSHSLRLISAICAVINNEQTTSALFRKPQTYIWKWRGNPPLSECVCVFSSPFANKLWRLFFTSVIFHANRTQRDPKAILISILCASLHVYFGLMSYFIGSTSSKRNWFIVF